MISLNEQTKLTARGGVFAALINKKEQIIDFSILSSIFFFLLGYFEPKYLLSMTITTGGDTASHYNTALYLRNFLLPQGKIIGWEQGNYAGFPLFQFYFPLPFVFIALLSYVIPLQIAFKIGTVVGIFLLPLLTYFALKLLDYRFPVPIFGALSTLPFLFMEANSMWGGNIPSTLAGEFTYSVGFALTILFMGSLYRGIRSNRHVVKNAILVALIGFSHGYTLLFAGFASLFFLITTEDFIKKFKYLFKIHTLGFMMMGLWIIPLLSNLPNTTRYNYVWVIDSLLEVLPVILLPWVGAAILGRAAGLAWTFWKKWKGNQTWMESWEAFWQTLDTRIYYLWFGVLIGVVFYLVAYKINVVDIRFLPFLQLLLMIIASIELGRLIQRLTMHSLFAVIFTLLVFVWVDTNEASIKSWIDWNYTGFEAKPLWTSFSSLNQEITGTLSDPRVVYEHSALHNNIGTPRAFESLPLFAGRSTLEGLYMQSSISSPFVFYIQSEISKEISCPLPDYSCSSLNLKEGIRHLQMFNVKDFIVRSDEIKAEIKKYPDFVLKKQFGPFDLYELSTNENRYVTRLKYEPILFETKNHKMISYKWFRNPRINDVHLVFTKKTEEKDLKRFANVIRGGDFDPLPKTPVPSSCAIEEKIKEEEISIKTTCLHKPLLIKISYHPNWKVEGADKIYHVSPSFMLIYPERENVTLRFSKTGVEYTGLLLTLLAIFIAPLNSPLLSRSTLKERIRKTAEQVDAKVKDLVTGHPLPARLFHYTDRNRLKVLLSTLATLTTLSVLFFLSAQMQDPNILHKRGIGYFNDARWAEAREIFGQVLHDFPETGPAYDSSYFYAITYYKEENYPKTLEAFEQLIKNYSDSNWVPEAYYHIGLVNTRLNQMEKARETYRSIVAEYPTSNWAEHARARLDELEEAPVAAGDPDTLYNRAMASFDRGRYDQARELFLRVSREYPATRVAEYSGYFYAICFFKENRFEEVIDHFEGFIKDHPRSEYVAEAYYHIGVSYQRLSQKRKAETAFEKVIKDFPKSRWEGFSKEALKQL